jgi:hypothetical protein
VAASCDINGGEPQRYGIEPGKVTAGLAQLLALSGIDKSFEEGQEWLQVFLLFEVSGKTIRAEAQGLGELQRQAEEEWIKETHNEAALQKREQIVVEQVSDRLYGLIDAPRSASNREQNRAKSRNGRRLA